MAQRDTRAVGFWMLLLAATFVGVVSCDDEKTVGAEETDHECANAACSLPPLCGRGCTARCGCCGCADGQTFRVAGNPYVCQNQCLEPVSADAGGDAALDCSTVGCSPAPLCETGCTAACGCCSCAPGEIIALDAGARVCVGGCYARADAGQ